MEHIPYNIYLQLKKHKLNFIIIAMFFNMISKTITSPVLFRYALFLPRNRFGNKKQTFKQSQRDEISRNITKGLKFESKGRKKNDREKQLWQILQEKAQVINGIAEVSQAISLCQSITDYYNIQRLGEFTTSKKKIEKLLNNLTFLPFEDLNLENYFILLKFLAVVSGTHQIKVQTITALKDLIFLNIKAVVNSLETLTMPQLVTLYATLAPFNHPQLITLAQKVEVQITESKKQLNYSLAEAVMVGLSYRKFLSVADIRVTKLIYQVLKENSDQIPLPTLAKLYETSQSMGLASYFGDYYTLACLHHFHNELVSKLGQVPLDDPSVKYLITSNLTNLRNPAIFVQILESTFKKIEQGVISCDILPCLVSCLQKTRQQLHEGQINKVITFLEKSRKDQLLKSVIFLKYPLAIVVLDLVKTSAFDSHLLKFKNIINSTDFDSKWSLISLFSLKNVPYPILAIEKKIKIKTSDFTLDSNYLKASTSIGLQIKHHPNSMVIASAYQRLQSVLYQYRWGEDQLEWFGKVSQEYPELIKIFHQLYGHIYMKRLSAFITAHHPTYYLYLMAIEDYDFSLESIKAFPLNKIFEIMQREIRLKFGEFVYGFLLFMIHQKLQLKQIELKGDFQTKLLRLMLKYSNYIHSSSPKTVKIYHKLVIKLFDSYKNLKGQTIEFDHILRRLLKYPSKSRYYGTPQYTDLVNECLKHIADIINADLVAAIIRCCIKQKKAIPSFFSINKAYFSEEELAQIQFDK